MDRPYHLWPQNGIGRAISPVAAERTGHIHCVRKMDRPYPLWPQNGQALLSHVLNNLIEVSESAKPSEKSCIDAGLFVHIQAATPESGRFISQLSVYATAAGGDRGLPAIAMNPCRQGHGI